MHDWICKICKNLGFADEVAKLACSILDRLNTKIYQELCAACCIMIASKYYEDIDYVLIDELRFLFNDIYSKSEIVYCEVQILKYIDWNIH